MPLQYFTAALRNHSYQRPQKKHSTYSRYSTGTTYPKAGCMTVIHSTAVVVQSSDVISDSENNAGHFPRWVQHQHRLENSKSILISFFCDSLSVPIQPFRLQQSQASIDRAKYKYFCFCKKTAQLFIHRGNWNIDMNNSQTLKIFIYILALPWLWFLDLYWPSASIASTGVDLSLLVHLAEVMHKSFCWMNETNKCW